VILAFIGTILLIVALIFFPSISSDWLRLRVFDDGIQNDAATVLKNTLEGGKDVYGIGVVAEKGKEGLCKLGLWIFTVGATGYMAFGQRDGGWWFFIGWGTVALLGISNWLMVKYVLK
jgi:hypothetical protein